MQLGRLAGLPLATIRLWEKHAIGREISTNSEAELDVDHVADDQAYQQSYHPE
jgi:hypothetical protein